MFSIEIFSALFIQIYTLIFYAEFPKRYNLSLLILDFC